ncbi:MAG: redoxin domain-containing protein, partial [Candidatus Firestonebacteria bacterium]
MRAKRIPEFKKGDLAPEFTLPSSSGKDFTLSKVLGKKALVLFFYPKDFSPGCTTEVCTFR